MDEARPDLDPRGAFAERFALLYASAGNPTLERVAKSVARTRRLDEQGRPARVSTQRVSDWRRGTNVPARFAPLAAVLEVLIGEARKNRSHPAVEGLYDMDAWRSWWEEALASPAASAATDRDTVGAQATGQPLQRESGVCPYRGLAAFREEDTAWFFGRERSTAALLARLAGALPAGGIVMLVGPSGAGKSSLMRAGLGPALTRGALPAQGSADWPIVMMTPGADPLKELGRQIPELAETLDSAIRLADADLERFDQNRSAPGDASELFDRQPLIGENQFTVDVRKALAAHAEHRAGAGARTVLLVDQFEEAFTLCEDAGRLRIYIHALNAASTPMVPGGVAPGLVVLGIRADFYGRCLDHPELERALQNRQMVLGPMTAGELREAVVGPAKAVGLQLDTGLPELILRDLSVSAGRAQSRAGQGVYDAGALPLLSHSLLATWQRRRAGKLTIAGYRAAGGIQGAVATTAERAWADLCPAGQTAARAMLLRLVRVGKDTQDTRRRATRAELLAQAEDRTAAAEALEVLARARLVTLDAGSVDITHEALLQAWPRLRGWIDQDRAGNILRQRLEEDASAWADEGRDSSLLYRGARLETAQQRAQAAGSAGLTAVGRDFLAVSARYRRRTTWVRRAAVAAVVAFALTAAAAATVAFRQRDDAVFGQLVTEADRMRQSDPSLSAQLDLVAHRMRPDDGGVRARVLSTQNVPLATPLSGHTGAVYLTSFSPDGRTLATASFDRTVRLWDVHDRSRPAPLGRPLTGHTSWVSSAVFSPDGRTLATAGDDRTVRLWNVADPAHAAPLGPPLIGGDLAIYLVAFSPDGRTLAAANGDRTARLWDVRNPDRPVPLGQPLAGHTAAVRSLAFSPDSRTLATGSDDKTVRLWDIRNPDRPVPLGQPLAGHANTVHSVAFNPDGHILATGSEDKTVRLWDVSDPARPTPFGQRLTGHDAPVWSVAFSPDGRMLASGSADGTTRLWTVADPARAEPVGQPLAARTGIVYAVSFSPDGRTLATGSDDSTVRLWSLPARVLYGHSAGVLSTAFSPDGRVLASGSADNTTRLWDVHDPSHPAPFGPPLADHTGLATTVAFSPDGRVLALGSADRVIHLWDVHDPGHPTPVGQPLAQNAGKQALFSPDGHLLVSPNEESVQLWDIRDRTRPAPVGVIQTGHTGYITSVAFSPDGRTLVTASFDTTVRLWDVTNPAAPTARGRPLAGHSAPVWSAAFSPDGHLLATASGDKTIRLWDTHDPSRPVPVGSPLAGHTDVVSAVTFSPDGRTLASASYDKTVRLWNMTDRAMPVFGDQSLTGHTGILLSLAFSPDGKSLATGSGDTTARLWEMNIDHVIQRICAATRGVLSSGQWRQFLPQLPYQPPCG
ncbi:MAG TPA: AAA family ATPase [Planosporangium sp.]|jgi:WD40 repeat protein|nr:AAA family ATPase [Planosporangium sp.]